MSPKEPREYNAVLRLPHPFGAHFLDLPLTSVRGSTEVTLRSLNEVLSSTSGTSYHDKLLCQGRVL